MKKVRKTISIENFIKLYKIIQDRDWDSLMPTFWNDIKGVWAGEMGKLFMHMKKSGSYGPVDLEGFKLMLQNTNQTFLPGGISYAPWYAKKYPLTYVKTGYLKRKMKYSPSVYQEIKSKDMVGIRVVIPTKKDGTDGYVDLEEKRSFVKASFVLSWPKILQKTLESMI